MPLWITISAPKSNGRDSTGVKKVLSTIINKLCFFANFEISATSHSSINGLDGVSIKIAFVFAVIAASISAKEAVFT